MRIMRMIGLGAMGYGMYRAWKSFSATKPSTSNRVVMDRNRPGNVL